MKNRIEEWRTRRRLSQRALAKLAGTSGQQIGMLERGERGLDVEWLKRLSKPLECDPADLLPLTESVRSVDIKGVVVRGAVQAGAWRESSEWPEDDWYPVPMSSEDPRYPSIPLFGLEVRGTSMDRVFPPGTILACIHLIQHPVEVVPGKFVIAERMSASTGEIEVTVKQIEMDPDGHLWLWPRSNDPLHQAPLRVDDGEEVRVTALVVRSSRPE